MTPTRGRNEPSTMLAVVAERPGPLGGVLALRDLPAPDDLAPCEVLVRMLAAAVNPSDAVTVSGAYASRTSFPFVPGFEGVGVIERAGSGVPEGMIGRRVLPVGAAGCWAQYKRAELSWCVPVPEDIPDEAACFAYVNPLTAWLMVERFCSGGARGVAITAATSTIAGHLAEVLDEHGIRPIGLIRGTPGRDVAEPSLWRAVIDTSDPAWPELLRRASGGRLDVVLDCVGGPQGVPLVRGLTPGGVLVHYGLLSGEPLPAECFDGRDGRKVEMLRLRDAVHSCPRHDLPALFRPVFERMRSGRLLTRPARRVPLSSLPEALRDSGCPSGKVLVECER
ncbi:zinc-dependent alcohol dehydrogenase family protein [Streptomyces acidicola]|uniref:zinc-dependent alcohol dehydrogenase family protein n=1 Tax=Streptomyces acidicola TaxID=2596892 RepID=UPI00341DB638